MKKNFARFVCMCLALGMMLSATACKSNTDTESQDSYFYEEEDTEYDDEEYEDEEEDDEEDNESHHTSSKHKKPRPSKPGNKPDGKPDDEPDSGSANEDNLGGKNFAANAKTSWKQVLNTLPKNKFKGKQIELFHWNPASELQGADKLLKNFTRQTGINVKWKVASYDNYDVELQARIASNNSPDIVLFQWMNVNRVSLCQPITNSGFNFNTADWDKDLMDYYSINGKVYAVNMKDTLLNRPAAMFYNRDVIEKFEFEDPYELWKQGKWTDTKFLEMCQAFKEEVNGPAWVVSKFDVWANLCGLQCELSFKDGKYGNNLNDPRTLAAFQKCAKLNDDGLTDRSWDSGGFGTGKFMFMDSSLMFTRSTQPYFETLKSNGTLGTVPYFTITGQDKQYQRFDEYEAYGLANGSKNGMAAAYFLRYYLDPAQYDEKTFFCDSQALEVYKYSMKQPNRLMHNRYPLGSGNSASPMQAFRLDFEHAAEPQIASVINKHKGAVDKCVAELNEKLSKLS